MSMPEEIIRLCTDVSADLLFTTDPEAGDNLARRHPEDPGSTFVGNTMIDTLIRHVSRARSFPCLTASSKDEYAVLPCTARQC